MVYSTPSKKRGLDGTVNTEWGGCFDEKDYARGAIKRIKVENFMTYREATVYPGPRLNLVLGPNGSGKSSIVCAVGIALCANQRKLGRSDQVKEYVRKGQAEGSVSLVISGGPTDPDYVIERRLHADKNSSAFKINGATKRKEDVEALNKKLTIQLDNLCQFLPQELVQNFSKMSPTELLQSTEAAVGDGSLLKMHDKLMDGGRALAELQTTETRMQRQLDQKREQRDGMQHDVAKIQEHDELTAKARLHRARAAQLRAHEAQVTHEERKAAHDEKQGELAAVEKELEKSKKPAEKIQKEVDTLKKREQELGSGLNKQTRAFMAVDEELDALQTRVGNLHREVEGCEAAEVKRQASLFAERKVHQDTLDKLDALPDKPAGYDAAQEAQLKKERAQLQSQLVEVSQQRKELTADKRQLDAGRKRAEKKLHDLQQVQHKRLRDLSRREGFALDQFTAEVRALDQQHHFRGHVYGPILAEMEMSPDAPAHAAPALENAIPQRLHSAFVVEYKEDQIALQEVAKQKGLKGVNVVHFAGNASAPVTHRAGAVAPRTLGALDIFFQAPGIIKHVLCDSAGLNGIYLIEHERGKDAAFDAAKSSLVYSPTGRHGRVVSMYGGGSGSKASYSDSLLRGAQLLNVQVDQAALAAVEGELAGVARDTETCTGKMAELDEREAEVTQARGAVDKQLKELADAVAAHRKLAGSLKYKVETTEKAIAKLDKEAPLVKKPQLEADLKKAKREGAKKGAALATTLLPSMAAGMKATALLAAQKAQLQDTKVTLEAEKDAANAAAMQLRDAVRALAHDLQEAKVAHQERRKAAADATRELTDGQREELAGLPDDVAANDDAADAATDKAQRMTVGDRNVIQRYQALCKALEAQEVEKAKHDADIVTLQGELEEAKARWLPELKEKVAAISGKFSANFARLGSVGEVGLFEAGEAYDQYAIEIRVKFRRQGDLEPLSNEVHSGGEKSVSTIMFLLSLQKITATPFRVVDEINQGMDQTNERKVFQAMVDAATEANTAQCLLMTPKLLPQLEYSEHVNVLGIVNGAYVHEPQKRLQPSRQLELLLGTHAPQDVA